MVTYGVPLGKMSGADWQATWYVDLFLKLAYASEMRGERARKAGVYKKYMRI